MSEDGLQHLTDFVKTALFQVRLNENSSSLFDDGTI